MIKAALRPYPGSVIICKSADEYRKQHKKLFNEDIDLSGKNGRMDGLFKNGWPTYLVWGTNQAYLAHEIAHVILHVFELVNIDPREANGEPFCYLLSQLMLDSRVR